MNVSPTSTKKVKGKALDILKLLAQTKTESSSPDLHQTNRNFS